MNNDKIEFSYGGFFDGYKTIRYTNGTVVLSNSQKPFNEQTNKVSDEKLEDFWQQIESIGVWDWQDKYEDPNVLDGFQWNLTLVHGEREKKIYGSNMFPPDISITVNRKSDPFHQLCQAVNTLVGRKYFNY
ncbi:MAG: hypothetical protein PWQ84_1989 [Thermotogaceae bacterium]|nr:hypothetical protein [Thermotogaceae bacterium]